MAIKTKSLDMTKGPILKNLFIFSIPLIISNVLQILFNTVDTVVVGIYESDSAVAAVGANGPIVALMISLFVGMSVATNILLGKYLGAGEKERAGRIVGTSILVSLLSGVLIATVGFFLARPLLVLVDCVPEVLDLATQYLKIYFLGMPVIMLYNYSASILRASGDTFHPMLFICIAGIINVGLNFLLVGVFNLGVAGVAIATVVSQAFSAIASLIVIIKQEGPSKLQIKHLRIYFIELKGIVFIGIPSGIQTALFSISNIVVLSSINSFGLDFVSSYAIVQHFENVIGQIVASSSVAALSYMSQNYGAKDLKRMKQTCYFAYIIMAGLTFVVGGILLIFAKMVFRVMADSSIVVDLAFERLAFMLPSYLLLGLMESFSSLVKSFGRTTTAMILTLVFACAFRIIYLKTYLPTNKTHFSLYAVYPISWILTTISLLFALIFIFKIEKRKLEIR